MPSDAQLTASQRSAAIDRAEDDLALISGAGCGKTYVLARRFMELLARRAGDGEALSRLVALTFTEKAALEMSTRVRQMLLEAAAGAEPSRRSVLRGWLDELPEARISTIHGFCAAVLRSRAVEAGIDPNFAVCEDSLFLGQMQAEAAEQALLEAVEAGEPGTAALVAELGFDSVVEEVRGLLSRRAECDPAGLGNAKAVMARWRRQVEVGREKWLAPLVADGPLREQLERLRAVPCSDPGDRLAIFREEQLGLVEAILADPVGNRQLFAGLNARCGNIGTKGAWGDRDTVREVRGELKELIRAVQEYRDFAEDLGEADEAAAAHLAALAGLARRADALYTAEKRRRGLLDFEDLLVHTERLLAESEPVRRALAEGIDQLLIDECQDTNAFQVRMLRRLLAGRGQAGQPGRGGRLFVVGDAKQSIYRFRGAQVEVFERLCGELGADSREHLAVSFRTHAAGIAFVNHVFAPLMGPAYEPVEAHRPELPEGPSVEILLAAGPDGHVGSAEQAVGAQAAAVAERIAQMLAGRERIVRDERGEAWRAVEPRDVAILFGRMTQSLEYERQLERRGVPYYVVAGTGFFQQQEVFDVLNALEAVDNPLDDIPLLGTLRSGIFGLDDNTLLHLAGGAEPPYFPALRRGDVPPGLPADQAEALERAVGLIGRLHGRKDAVGIDELLEELLAETGYEAALLARPGGKRALYNVRMVVERARAGQAEGLSLAEFVAQMRELILNESRYEQAAVAGEQENVVRLMTVHKAKGLEFPVVVLPDLNAAGRRGRDGRCMLREGWGAVFRPPGADDDNAEPPSWRIVKRLEEQDDRREAVRKLYVAATRHRDYLLLVGADWRNADGRLRQSASPLADIDGVLGLAAAVDAGEGHVSYGPQGRYRAVVRRVTARRLGPRPRGGSGARLLAAARSGGDLGRRMVAAGRGGADLPGVGPLPVEAGRVELAVTALNDFAHCPMHFRWGYDLRVPVEPAATGAAGRAGAGGAAALDATTLGTLYHLCMEHLDFKSPQPAGALVALAAAEMQIEDSPALEAAAADLEEALGSLREHELWGRLAGARRCYRELDFVLSCGPGVLRGQVDVLFEDAGGAWHVVDYKSDRVAGEALARRAEGYELQLLLYALAVERHVGVRPAGAGLYFLRAGRTWQFDVSAEAVGRAARRAEQLARELISARRTGRFARREGPACAGCAYAELCERTKGS